MKTLLTALLLLLPVFVYAQEREYLTKGRRIYVAPSADDRNGEGYREDVDLSLVFKWRVDSTNIHKFPSKSDTQRRAINYVIVKKTEQGDGSIAYDTNNIDDGYPMRIIISANDITVYDFWPSWDMKYVHTIKRF